MTGMNVAQEASPVDHHEVGKYWEGNAEVWARLSRQGYNASRDEITMPAFLALLPEVAGLSGLDIGCGEGHSTRLLARRGATMTAGGIAPPLLPPAPGQGGRKPLGIALPGGRGPGVPLPRHALARPGAL